MSQAQGDYRQCADVELDEGIMGSHSTKTPDEALGRFLEAEKTEGPYRVPYNDGMQKSSTRSTECSHRSAKNCEEASMERVGDLVYLLASMLR